VNPAIAGIPSRIGVLCYGPRRSQAAIPGGKDRYNVLPIRLDLLRLLHLVVAALALSAPAAAHAQAKLDARYTAYLGGVTIGRGAWVIDFRDDQYTAAASGMATGLLKMFAGGTGTSASRGNVSNGQPISRAYASTITANKKKDEVEVALENGTVKEFT